jgi:hypothetical protein
MTRPRLEIYTIVGDPWIDLARFSGFLLAVIAFLCLLPSALDVLLPLVVWIIFDTRFQWVVACVIVGWLAERAVKAIWRAMLRDLDPGPAVREPVVRQVPDPVAAAAGAAVTSADSGSGARAGVSPLALRLFFTPRGRPVNATILQRSPSCD